MKNNNIQKDRGFTLLFAVLVSVLILAVGASIISIALKQVILSGAGRESQYAFYAANTGIECALFWDIQGNGGTNVYIENDTQSSPDDYTTSGIDCAGGISDILSNGVDSTEGETTFRVNFTEVLDGDAIEYCADVTVNKDESGGSPNRIVTTIESRGYNTCDENNPRRIERGLELTY